MTSKNTISNDGDIGMSLASAPSESDTISEVKTCTSYHTPTPRKVKMSQNVYRTQTQMYSKSRNKYKSSCNFKSKNAQTRHKVISDPHNHENNYHSTNLK